MSLSASWNLLEESDVIRLGLLTDNSVYIVPLNHVVIDKTVYFHSAKSGRKVDYIKANNKVCLETDEMIDIKHAQKGCRFSCYYKSVIAYGDAFFVNDRDNKKEILNHLVKKYAVDDFEKVEIDDVDNIHVIGIEITEIVGKELLP